MKCLHVLLLMIITSAAMLLPASYAAAQQSEPVKITLHPMAEPVPALKYELLPAFINLRSGNAAVDYGKVTAEETHFFSNHQLLNEISELQEAPLDKLRTEEIRKKLQYGSILDKIRSGATREHIDWQLPIREGGYYLMLLGEAQQTRAFARLLGARARMHIARGEFDEAVQVLQLGYAVAQHVAEGETLVNGLIGMAISGMMSNQVREFIQQPGAPNLYWALTALPVPLIDLRNAAEAERAGVELSFPELREVEQENWAARHWQNFLDKAIPQLVELEVVEATQPRLMLTFRTLKLYPMAKEFLSARGYSDEQLEGMPVPQLVMLYTVLRYRELRDETFKWYNLPYAQAREGMEEAEKRISEINRQGDEILPLASKLIAAVHAARGAAARTDRDVAVLRLLEALRMYGAAHGGFPDKLTDLQVPVPLDPATGEHFVYQVKDGVAAVTGPTLGGMPLNLEVRFAGKKQP